MTNPTSAGGNEGEGKNKITGMTEKVKNQAKEAVKKAGDSADQKTGDKFSDKVDQGQEKAGEVIDRGTIL